MNMQLCYSGEFRCSLENYPGNWERIRKIRFSIVNVSVSVAFYVGRKTFISISIVDTVISKSLESLLLWYGTVFHNSFYD
jgi:hypothetical protein